MVYIQLHLDKHLEMAGFTESWVVVANGPQTLSANHKRLYYGTISLVSFLGILSNLLQL